MDKPTNGLVWNLALPFGVWKGYGMGETQEYNLVDGHAIVDYFNSRYAQSNRTMPIDYDHMTFEVAEAVAAGWIWKLEVRTKPEDFEDDIPEEERVPGVWMQNEWTPRAQERLDNNEYKYLSPVIVRNGLDPVTGDEIPIQLLTVALTNVPFMLDKFNRVKFAEDAIDAAVFNKTIDLQKTGILNNITRTNNMDLKEMFAAVKEALGLGAEAAADDVMNAVKKLVEFVKMFPEGEGEEMPAPEEMPEMAQNAIRAMQLEKKLTELFSVAPDKVYDNIVTLRQDVKKNSQGGDDSAKLREELAEMKAEHLIEKYADRIPSQNDRAYWKNKATKDYAGTEEDLKRMRPVLNSEVKRTVTTKGGAVLDESDLEVCRQVGIDPEKYAQELAKRNS